MIAAPDYIGKAEVAEMLDLTVSDFTKGQAVLARLGFPEANQTSPGAPRWRREAVESWRKGYWDTSGDDRPGQKSRSPEQSAMLNMARTP